MSKVIENIKNFLTAVEQVTEETNTGTFVNQRYFTAAEAKSIVQKWNDKNDSDKKMSIPSCFWNKLNSQNNPRIAYDIENVRARLTELENKFTKSSRTQKNNSLNMSQKAEIIEFSFDQDDNYMNYIPTLDPTFVSSATGENYNVINNVVKSGEFFPIYIYGISGIGKTASIEHICATNSRPFFRVQITSETIDDDLIGSYTLKDGNTVWEDGPVIKAYRSGGICLIDEIDLNQRLMILQPVLEGKAFYIKQTGELVYPKQGFNVFATGNTKGDGNDDRYVGTTILNDAFKDRFAIMLEQVMPSKSDETKIAKKVIAENKVNISDYMFKTLMTWIDETRKTYKNTFESDSDALYVSTRRVSYILKTYKLLNNMEKSIKYALSRYNNDIVDATVVLWNSLYDEQLDGNKDNNEDLTEPKSNTEKTVIDIDSIF